MGIRPVPWSFTIEFDEGRAESAGYDVEELYDDTVNVFFTNRANGSAPSAQTHFHQSRKRAFAASG